MKKLDKGIVAIVDSGVEEIANYRGASVSVDEIGNGFMINDDYCDQNGHGTIVTNIIESLTDNVEFYIMKVFGQEEEVETEKLVFALKYLGETVKPDIIHLSLGVSFCDNIPLLQQVCLELFQKGIIIVSAFDNHGALSYPAAFPFVIGVEGNSKIDKTSHYYFLKNSPINIANIGVAQRLKGRKKQYYDVVGSSFSAPYITAKIVNLFNAYGTRLAFDDIMDMLERDAKKIFVGENLKPICKPFSIKKAILFPYNKEITTIIRHYGDMPFEVKGVYDVKFLRNIGKKISVGDDSLVIMAFEKINWESDFDTIIIGHLRELELLSKREYLKNIIDNCLKYRKNVYSLELLPLEMIKVLDDNDLKVFTPMVSSENVPTCYEGRLRQIGKPVLCVAGTSPKQGKFSLQIQLRDILSKQFKIGMLSTEPTGYLIGADVVFPMGYNSSIVLNSADEYITTANYAISLVEDLNVDLIITGLQSQTIPMQLCSFKDTVIFNHYFLLGTNPDAIVLVVNVFDEIEYIQRTINYLENILICEVIAIVVFPIQRLFKWGTMGDLSIRYDNAEIYEMKNRLSAITHKYIYIMDDSKDIQDLADKCIEFFVGES